MTKEVFEVLVPQYDHQYCMMTVQKGKAVWNDKYGTWTEYHGEEYLQDGDKVKEVLIAW